MRVRWCPASLGARDAGEQRGNSRFQRLRRLDWRGDVGRPSHRLTVGGLSPSGRHGFLDIAVIGFKIYTGGENRDMSFKATDSPEVHTTLLTAHAGCPGLSVEPQPALHVSPRHRDSGGGLVWVCGFHGISQPLGAGPRALRAPTAPSESLALLPLRTEVDTSVSCCRRHSPVPAAGRSGGCPEPQGPRRGVASARPQPRESTASMASLGRDNKGWADSGPELCSLTTSSSLDF